MSLPVRILSVAMMVLLSACASVPVELSERDEGELLERVAARWDALMARDFSKAYTFTSPAYREVFTETMYLNKFSYMVEWELTSAELLNYDADAAVASVAVRVMSKPVKQTSAASAAIGAVPTVSVEQWVMRDGGWWYSSNL